GFARRVNRPPRMLLRDDLIVEIARRAPRTLDELGSVRGLPRGQPVAILDAVRRAKSLPTDELPELEVRDNDPAHVILLGSLLGVVLADLCARKKLAANLVASGQDLKAVVRATAFGQPLPDVPLTRGWRGQVILPELHAILNGSHAVRVAKLSSAAPLAYLALEREVDPAPAAGPDRPHPIPSVLPPDLSAPAEPPEA